ncbi:MAG TPA: acyloxyacyl hydrolase [Cytophagaceae bacterium]|jgi:hypothetical protein|nr:acyloxyacyl hydrolase [Cytophagaceae bacterium]
MRILIFSLLLCSSFLLKAQNSPRPTYTVTARLHYGFIWNFSQDVSHLANQHMPGFELNFTKQTKGGKDWQREYRYPQVGYSLLYFAFDPSKPVGNALAAIIHAGKNFIKTKRSNLQWRTGLGLAYVEKRFNVETNYTNNVISERINFTLNGQINYTYQISSRLKLNFGIGLTHISNGALKRPNFGINLPTIHAGIGININDDGLYKKRDSVLTFKRKTHLYLSTFAGLKEVYPVNGPKYFLCGVNAYAERRLNRKSGINIGMDFSYDYSKAIEIVRDSINVRNTFINLNQVAIIAGHELYLNKLSLLTQMGVYLFDPTHLSRTYYQKVGLKYYISDKMFVGMALKIHLGVADWVEWGVGIKL